MRTNPMLAAFAVAALSIASTSARANMIVNGGFETGDFTGWTVNAGATSVQGAGYDGFNPHSGSYFAALGDTSSQYPYGTVSQTQTIADTAGQTLTLSYYLASDGALPNYFEALWNGTVISGSSVSNSAAFPYAFYQFNVVATGSDTVSFHEQNVPAYNALDDVSLDVSGQHSVPEPITAALFGVGLLGLVRRRRKAA